MDTANLKKFAQHARATLLEQVNTKLSFVLAKDSLARREHNAAVTELEAKIAELGRQQLIERVAYIWFNRFSALRYMDVNLYTRIGTVSPAEGQTQPEILAEAKMGHIDAREIPENIQQQVLGLLDGTLPSHDPQAEAYRLLLVATCNYWHSNMPFLFQRIDDYTQLLMPDNLLSTSSILTTMREAMTAEVCEDVEVIGWLYQFYISDKKDEVFAGLKKNEKVTPENIPAATQLFTPHWIVRYLVENSLGRLWLLNHPESALAESMEYYIKPAEDNGETDFLRVERPEDLKICDPACGSGHMLTYAFDLLYKIYEEQGHSAVDIPSKILTHNLYGIELDERAGELAAFALTMKARAKQKRFFSKKIRPNICVLEAIKFDKDELDEYMDFIGRDLFNSALETTLHQFEEADNFGSLIRPALTDVTDVLAQLESKDVSGQLFLSHTHEKVLTVLKQTDYLSPRYHVVVANPPYMGGSGMNDRLNNWLKEEYTDAKSDLFSAFIIRNTEIALDRGQLGFMTPFVWMFIPSYEKLRNFILDNKVITSLIQLEYSGFDGATVPICTFTLENKYRPSFKGGYIRLSEFKGAKNQSPKVLEAILNPKCGWFHSAQSYDFKKIPGSPIAYWVSLYIRELFVSKPSFENAFEFKAGISTGKNAEFILFWPEVSAINIRTDSTNPYLYTPHNKGGEFRKWMGNWDYVLKYSKEHIKKMEGNAGFRHDSKEYYFKKHIGWSKITSSTSSFRYYPEGFSLLFHVLS